MEFSSLTTCSEEILLAGSAFNILPEEDHARNASGQFLCKEVKKRLIYFLNIISFLTYGSYSLVLVS
jgi:hypothetical protein